MIIDAVKNFVQGECNKPANVLSPAFFTQHLLVVADYSKILAETLSADREIVELSAYLHDIAAVQNIALLPEHHTLSAAAARNILLQNNYPLEKTERVMQAITKHISPIQLGQGSLEDICLSNADAMSQITKPIFWMYFAFSIRRLNYDQGKEWLGQRIENNWNALIQPAKEIIEEEYNQVMNIISSEILNNPVVYNK